MTAPAKPSAEVMRRECALVLGWTRMGMYSHVASGKQLLGSRDTLHGTPPRDKDKTEDEQAYEPVPAFDSDLNACHEFENWLEYKCEKWFGDEGATSACEAYMHALQEITGNDDWMFCGASALQRLEAFLRVTKPELFQ